MDSKKPKSQAPSSKSATERCIWMTAGVIDEKWCDRDFNCAGCDFDHEIRQELSALRRQDPNPCLESDVQKDPRLFHIGHLWLQPLDDSARATPSRCARIGVDSFLAKLTFCVKQNILPGVGATLVQDRVALWLVDECGTLPLRAPISGKVRAINLRMIDNPDSLRHHDGTDSWLLELEPSKEGELASLMKAPQARRYWKAQEARFENLARAHVENKNRPATLADGGVPMVSWRELLGRDVYYQLLLAMLR